ncbi:hypothetical protein BDV18DRAFT_130333 [Aspergillus unguis]
MPLHALPVEILCTIIRYLGSAELRKHNAQGLLVCKWWHRLAEPILFEDLTLSAKQLLELPDSVQVKLNSHCRRLWIYATGTNDWPGDSPKREALNERFSVLLSTDSRLKSIGLQASAHFDEAQPLLPRHDYLSNWSPAGLVASLRTSNISHLVLDTWGSELKEDVHICPSLAQIIPSLRSVRLRMRKICPRALDLQQDASAVESIIVNLCLAETGHLSPGFSRHCDELNSSFRLFEDMLAVSTDVVKRSPGLKKMRILRHMHPSLDMLVHDCVSGRKMILAEGEEWDWSDDGSDLEEYISDQEFSSISSIHSEN